MRVAAPAISHLKMDRGSLKHIYQNKMDMTAESRRAIANGEGILQNCPDTRHSVVQCCITFPESGELSKAISRHTIGALLGINLKAVWAH
jgi:hypothetical protein